MTRARDPISAPPRPSDASTTDVARQAGVSIGTVSRVMNHHPTVATDLRKRVWLASRKLGFVPKKSHRCIGVVTGRHSPALPIGYVSVMTSLISQYLASHGYTLELIDIENLDLAYQSHIEAVIGVVFDHRLADLREIPNLPILTLNNPLTHLGLHSIRTDHYEQAAIATQYFLDRGHQRIGLLTIEPDEWGSQQRIAGYRDTLAKAGLPCDPAFQQFTIQQPAYEILTRWRNRDLTAILNFSEDTSLEVLHILSNVFKLQIGRDISTISLEDLPIYQYMSPPQTTIYQPLAELAELAVRKALELCRTRTQGARPKLIDINLSNRLIERDSVAAIPSQAGIPGRKGD